MQLHMDLMFEGNIVKASSISQIASEYHIPQVFDESDTRSCRCQNLLICTRKLNGLDKI